MDTWYYDRFDDREYFARCRAICESGLPVQLRFSSDDDNFVAVFIDPQPGFIELANPQAVARYEAAGWTYHVSITHRTRMTADDIAAWNSLRDEYDGQFMNLTVEKISSGATAVLAAEGLWADPRLLKIYANGTFGWKTGGLHMSM